MNYFPSRVEKLAHTLDWITPTTAKPLFYSSTVINFIISTVSCALSLIPWLRSRRQWFLALPPQLATFPASTEAGATLIPLPSDSNVQDATTDITAPTCLPWILVLSVTLTFTLIMKI